MGIKFTNNFVTTISAGINNSVTTIPITSATGFPSLGASDYAYCSLQKESPFTLEIVKVTAVSGTNLTVVRGQDGTSASAFNSGDAFELRVTAGGINDVVTTAGAALPKAGGTLTGNLTVDHSDQYYTGLVVKNNHSSTQSQWHVAAAGGTSGWGATNGNFIIRDDTTNSTGIEIEKGAGGASGALYIDSDGNVGIGTENPGSYTGVQSNLEVKNASHGGIAINAGTNSLGMLAFAQNGTHKWSVEMENSATPYLSFNEAGTHRMTIDAGGNVGIGTTSPADNLHLNESGATSSFIRFSNSNVSNGWSLGAHSGGRFQLSQNGVADRLIVDSSGNVGIGETTPLGTLHVKTSDSGATADASADDLVVENNSNTGISILSGASSTGSIYFGDSGSNWDGYIAYSQANRSMTLGTAQSIRMTILSTGNVGIGTSPAGRLHVDEHTSTNATILEGNGNGDQVPLWFRVKANNGNVTNHGIFGNAGSAGTDNTIHIGPSSSSGLTLGAAGQIGTSGANYGSSGQVLTSGGSGAAPAWGDAGGGAYSGWLIKTTTFTAASGDQLIAKHATTAFTITLPASPSEGDSVTLKNVGAALLTVGRNSQNIDSAAEDATMPTGNAAQLVYVDSTIGWTVL